MNKLDKLKQTLRNLGSVLVAFSGGVDSTFLLKVAHDVLDHGAVPGKKCIAVTAASSTYPKRELSEARKLAKKIGVKHIVISSEEMKIPKFALNPKNRCYYCKKELFGKLKKIAAKHSIRFVADASNYDDLKDFRPGRKALKEAGIISPLVLAKITKEEIRKYSKKLKLPTYKKPSFACLASRIPYGIKITKKKLKKIEKGEEYLRGLGISQVRARYHDNIARIEVMPKDFKKILAKREKITKKFKQLGFTYVTLDIKGYRTGAMNEK